jgi:vacuolar-type H+-ATPase catalytic subunit A/Vma1
MHIFHFMKAASLKEIKTELENLPPAELLRLALRLTKFKKENKELLTYLLFEATDEQSYVRSVNEMLDELFAEVNTKSIYIAKKNLRKIVRMAGRYIKYSDAETTEPDVLIHVCQKIKELPISIKKYAALLNLYQAQVKKISKAVEGMHEDIQYDYLKIIAELNILER